MSIRLLTDGLQQEAAETQRRQQYDVARAREPQNDPVSPEPTFLTGSGKRQELRPGPKPVVSTPPRQVSLKTRSVHNPWGVPGGIAARFGKDSLQESQITEPEQTEKIEETPEVEATTTVSEPVERLEEQPAEEEPVETKEEGASDEDDNARITIELQ